MGLGELGVLAGDGDMPLVGEVGEVGGVRVDPLPLELLFGLVGDALPLGGVAADGEGVDGEALRVEPVGAAVDGVEDPEGVDVPGNVVEVGFFTVPSDATHGVELPGAVVPGSVLGGVLGVPGMLWGLDGLGVALGGFGVVLGTVPDPSFMGEQGGRLPGVDPGLLDPGEVVPGLVVPGVVVPGAVAPGIAVPGVGTADCGLPGPLVPGVAPGVAV